MHEDDLKWNISGMTETFTIGLTGNGLSSTPLETEVVLPEIFAKTGDTVYVTARVNDINSLRREVQSGSIDGYRMRINFKKSLATPVSGRRDNTTGNFRIAEQEGSITANSLKEIVAEIPLITALGDTSATPIILEGFAWTRGGIIISRAATKNGLLTLTDIDSVNGVPRFLNTNPGFLKLDISPNPLTGESDIFASGFTAPAEISVYSITGEEVLKFPNVSASFKISRSQFLKSGIYYCRLRSGNFSVTRVLRVE